MIDRSRAILRRAPLVALAAALSACASQAPAAEPAPTAEPAAAAAAALRLAPGDTIEIAVLTAPELTRVVEIAPDGAVSPPLAGRVTIAGLAPETAADAIAQAYAGTLREPRIEIRPARFAPRD